MDEFAFDLGQLVAVAPSGIAGSTTPRGRVIGHVRYLDRTQGYVVSLWSEAHGTVMRHVLVESDLVALPIAQAAHSAPKRREPAEGGPRGIGSW